VPLTSSIVGASESLFTDVDTRWTMAYAAALGDTARCYFDTLDASGIIAHPLFPVCFEWSIITKMRQALERSGLTPSEARRGVHASHDLLIHAPVRPPVRLQSRAMVAGIERRKSGAYQLTKIETVTANGSPVCTSWYGAIYRDVAVEGPDRIAENPPPPPAPRRSKAASESTIPVAAGLAHVYSECARIFNPIHTDAAVAHGAGLPEIILHGTATLALAVSAIVAAEGNAGPARVCRIAGRFGAMVTMPSKIRLRIQAKERAEDGERIFFEVSNEENGAAIRDGQVSLTTDGSSTP
jgi:acyl dehydratase